MHDQIPPPTVAVATLEESVPTVAAQLLTKAELLMLSALRLMYSEEESAQVEPIPVTVAVPF